MHDGSAGADRRDLLEHDPRGRGKHICGHGGVNETVCFTTTMDLKFRLLLAGGINSVINRISAVLACESVGYLGIFRSSDSM
jgi:hypothetical protein